VLSELRSDHGAALDELFPQVIASLVDKDVVRVGHPDLWMLRLGLGSENDDFLHRGGGLNSLLD
jgi:hypothetical protein